MTLRGPLYTNPQVPYWNVGFNNGDNSVFIVRPGKPPAATNYYWPLTPDIREVRTWTFSEIPSRIPPPNRPFNQYDWPNPTPPGKIDLTWNAPLFIGRIPSKPGLQTDWPVPTPPFRMEQTWIHTPTVIPPPNKPFNQTDWPAPAFSVPYRIEQTGVDPNPVLPTPVQGFNQYDWPNPTQPDRIQQTWINIGTPNVQGFNQYSWPLTPAPTPIDPTWIIEGIGGGIVQPFSQTDWPLPVQPFRMDATWVYPPIRVFAAAKPFNTYDWPLPTAPYRPEYTWIQTPDVIPPPNKPFNVTDWPLPGQPYRIDQTWVIPHTLIPPATPIPPGSNYDWPNPRDPRDYRSWVWTEYPGSIPPPNQPFNQYDWPVPKGYPRLDETYVWYFPEVNLAIPFSQHDWPLPGRYPTPDGTWINIQQITPFVQAPFNQKDWPVPIGYPRPDGTWISPGIQQATVVPMPLLTTRENVVYYPKFFSIDSIPPNVTVFIPPIIPSPTPVGGGREEYRGDELERLQARWKRDYEEMIKSRPLDPSVQQAAAVLSSLGGHARAKSLTSKQRTAIASKAASTRWNKR